MNWVDFHCHLSDPRFTDIDSVISRSVAKGVTGFYQGGVGPEDWQRQIELQQKFPKYIRLGFGLHPYWVSAHSPAECNEAITQLKKQIGGADYLGELGLDFREKIVGQNRAHQIFFFETQLEIVRKSQKVAVFHFVRCHDDASRILKNSELSKGGVVHAFNSDYKTAKKYLDLGLMLSIGGPLLRANNDPLRSAVSKVPIERILIESDSPDQAPPSRGHEYNEPWTIIEVARGIADLKGISLESVNAAVRKNTILESLHR